MVTSKFFLLAQGTLFLYVGCRLGVEWIDRYLIHSPIGGKMLETWDAMVELQSKKLVRSIGVSNFSEVHLQELKKARPANIPVGKQESGPAGG